MKSKNTEKQIHFDEKENQELINLLKSGELYVAKKRAKQQLKKYPKAYVIHNIFGAIMAAEKKFNEAIIHYKKSIEIKFDYAEAHNNLGISLQKLNNLKDAMTSYKNALKYKPNFSDAQNNLGTTLRKFGKFEEAILRYYQALKINPNYAEAYNNLGNALVELGKFEEAIINHQNAIKINPNYAEAYSNMGNALAKLGKFEEAITNHQRALKIDSNYVEAHSNLGNTLAELGKFEEATTSYQKALKINPKYIEANFNQSIVQLTLGDFAMGWKNYESRFAASDNLSMRYSSDKIWKGDYLDGTLLVWAEQGIGDHILFLSMITDLEKYAKNIILEIDKRLVNLFKRYCEKINYSNIKVLGAEKKLIDDFDKHIAIGSLGQYLRKSKKFFEKTPKKYLIPSPSKELELKKNFLSNKKFKVGICWKTLNKKQQYRNIDLNRALPILSNPNCDFINLQFGEFDKDLQSLYSKHGINVQTLRNIDNYNDIESLAALINSLDLVITIQNSTAHLAGALGKETWIMLAKNARWHWLVDEKKSIWYPAVKLFRQEKIGYWDNVINNVGKDLKKIV